MVQLYLIGFSIAAVGFGLWQGLPWGVTDVIGQIVFGLGVLIAGSMELVGLLLLPFRAAEAVSKESSRDRKADKAHLERAAARQRHAARLRAIQERRLAADGREAHPGDGPEASSQPSG